MSIMNSFSEYTNKYNANVDVSLFFHNTNNDTSDTSSVLLKDHAAIKNGSYGKLLKAYYANQDAKKFASQGDSLQKRTLMKSSADSLKKSADTLNDPTLWEKKTFKKKDEVTGEVTEVVDYDWNAITKAVKSFIEDYNDVVEQAGESNTKTVLRNAAWMTNMTEKSTSILAKVGITIGKGNKLELDEETLKAARASDLKTVFLGVHSFANRISQKAANIASAANKTGGLYTSSGTYSKTLSALVVDKIDKEV